MADVQRELLQKAAALDLPQPDCPLFDLIAEVPDLALQPTTPAFEYPHPNLPETIQFIGPLLPSFPLHYAEPGWWPELQADRPVILATQGTMTREPSQLLIPAIEALANQEPLLIVTTGHRPVSALGPLPANVRAEPFIPYDRLLPHVDLVVTNGGYGTIQLALAHGIPLVVAGRTEEKLENGARVAWAGVGVNLKTNAPKAGRLGRAIRRVLERPAYRLKAEAMRDDFARYDAPHRAVGLIEALAGHSTK